MVVAGYFNVLVPVCHTTLLDILPCCKLEYTELSVPSSQNTFFFVLPDYYLSHVKTELERHGLFDRLRCVSHLEGVFISLLQTNS